MKKFIFLIGIGSLLISGCASWQRLGEGMYEEMKTHDRISNPKYNEEHIQQNQEPMSYHEYRERIQESTF